LAGGGGGSGGGSNGNGGSGGRGGASTPYQFSGGSPGFGANDWSENAHSGLTFSVYQAYAGGGGGSGGTLSGAGSTGGNGSATASNYIPSLFPSISGLRSEALPIGTSTATGGSGAGSGYSAGGKGSNYYVTGNAGFHRVRTVEVSPAPEDSGVGAGGQGRGSSGVVGSDSPVTSANVGASGADGSDGFLVFRYKIFN